MTNKRTFTATPENRRILAAGESLTIQDSPSYDETIVIDVNRHRCVVGGIALTFEQARDVAYHLLSLISGEMPDAEYEAGSIAGYEAGYQAGYEEGREEGYDAAYEPAYDRGYEDALADYRPYDYESGVA